MAAGADTGMAGARVSQVSRLKAEFVRTYRGNGHIREAIPVDSSELIPINEGHLAKLHEFAACNPIYYNSYDTEMLGILCRVYEGDINEHWISSTKHDVSNQPFYPTWILSAYEAVVEAREVGATEVVDIGSGDGRIAYCGQVAGLNSYGVEIDAGLAKLQHAIAEKTGVGFGMTNADANELDYSLFGLRRPAFFIGGLPEMGEMLAKSVVGRVMADGRLADTSVFVFMGSFQLKRFSRSTEKWGWGFFIDGAGLDVKSAVVLPTCWTMDQQKDTPYIFTTRRGYTG